jgi:hypothetical protein
LLVRKEKVSSFPFLVFDYNDDPIKMATNLYLLCKRRGGSKVINPYSKKYNGFHITFFEKLDGEENSRWPKLQKCERWDIGWLYCKPYEDAGNNKEHDKEDLLFWQSLFTISPLSLAECKQVILTRQMLATTAHVKDAQLEG